MHPMRHVEEIKSVLDPGEEGAAEVRAAVRLLERETPIAAVLAAVACEDFPAALVRAAEGGAPAVRRAWFTVAAAGARRARRILAWRASEALGAAELAEAIAGRGGRPPAGCARRAATAGDEAGAWRLLSRLSALELRRLVRGRPALAAHYRQAWSR
jgi:hypothetical protein